MKMAMPKHGSVKDSDKQLGIYCKPCKTSGVNREATGYCGRCEEYLCVGCSRFHRTSAASRGHTLMAMGARINTDTVSRVKVTNGKTTGRCSKARYVRDICVKSEDDRRKTCCINGIVTLTEDRIVVTDTHNRAVKLVDVRLNRVTSRLILYNVSVPLDITRTKPNEVAVALGLLNMIELFTVSDILTRTRTIDVRLPSGEYFHGLCYHDDIFLLVHPKPRVIRAFNDKYGSMTTLYTGNDSDSGLEDPRHIAVDRNKGVMYVTGHENTVTCVSLNGQITSVYRHDALITPNGVSIDRDGNVYVCGFNSHTVHQLSAKGDNLQVILDTRQGLTEYPSAVAYDDDKGMLYISNESKHPELCNHIQLFQLQ